MRGFREKLAQRAKKVGSDLCVGLDPLLSKLPNCIRQKRWYSRNDWEQIVEWMIDIVDATVPFVAMFKPQKAHYEAINNGNKALRVIVDYIHKYHPDIPVFLDCKRGDIGRTQDRYRVAHFELDKVDGMNFSPYMGKSCMESLFDSEEPGRAIVGLCHTSNPEAREVQDVMIKDSVYYWEFIASKIQQWAFDIGINENAGLVMAAAYKRGDQIYSYHLSHVREIVGNDLWFLIPGVGTQGGFVEETVRASFTGPGSIAINSSSGIIFASQGEDYARASAQKAEELRDQIRKAGGSYL